VSVQCYARRSFRSRLRFYELMDSISFYSLTRNLVRAFWALMLKPMKLKLVTKDKSIVPSRSLDTNINDVVETRIFMSIILLARPVACSRKTSGAAIGSKKD